MSNTGKILQVIGPVVDVQFAEDALPAIYQALTIDFTVGGQEEKLTLEVQQHLGEGVARTVAMSSTEGLKRDMDVVDTGSPISVPVGEGVLGRIFNVTGDTVDGRGSVEHEKKYPIHRPAPPLTEQDTKANILETGIKVIDLICPFIPRHCPFIPDSRLSGMNGQMETGVVARRLAWQMGSCASTEIKREATTAGLQIWSDSQGYPRL